MSIGGRDHFRSPDKDGFIPFDHPIPIAENPMLHANFTALSSIEPDLLPIKVFPLWYKEFRAFFPVTMTLT